MRAFTCLLAIDGREKQFVRFINSANMQELVYNLDLK